MKKIYIFTRSTKSYAPNRLLKEIQDLGHTGTILNYAKIVFEASEQGLRVIYEGTPLTLPDVVIFRAPGMDGFCSATRDALLKWFLKNNVRVLNSETFSKWSTLDKLTQHIEFAHEGVPFIETKIVTRLSILHELITGYPVIVKSFLGSHGDGVKKIENESDLKKLNKEDAPFLLQPFLKSGRDVRVIIVGTKALGAMLRTAKDGAYLTNYSAGGDVELFDLSKNPIVAEIAEKAARVIKCEYAGVDLMQDDKGEWKVLEVNRSCQFEGFEEATGDNVAQKILQYLLQ